MLGLQTNKGEGVEVASPSKSETRSDNASILGVRTSQTIPQGELGGLRDGRKRCAEHFSPDFATSPGLQVCVGLLGPGEKEAATSEMRTCST